MASWLFSAHGATSRVPQLVKYRPACFARTTTPATTAAAAALSVGDPAWSVSRPSTSGGGLRRGGKSLFPLGASALGAGWRHATGRHGGAARFFGTKQQTAAAAGEDDQPEPLSAAGDSEPAAWDLELDVAAVEEGEEGGAPELAPPPSRRVVHLKQRDRLLLVDASALVFRAYYGFQHLQFSAKGRSQQQQQRRQRPFDSIDDDEDDDDVVAPSAWNDDEEDEDTSSLFGFLRMLLVLLEIRPVPK